ncbi:unnamed protein product, partial [Mesorhabditis belari]|uniref:C-type lectin domain-containing protein n=1 Tax=Mesorhabditis belari TaxID=2138241 RepID=A0AAF3J765_9BILA
MPHSQYSKRATSYMDVIRRCDNSSGGPAKIQNAFENSFIFTQFSALIDSPYMYIGVERKNATTWTYADGSPLTYQNWGQGEPDNSNPYAACAVMTVDGKWRANNCTGPAPYACTLNGDNYQCPDGWVYNRTATNQGFCYYVQKFLYQDQYNWVLYNFAEAESICQMMGAHLASIHSPAEDAFLQMLLYSNVQNMNVTSPCDLQFAWIGLTGTGILGNGTWIDGTPFDYTEVTVPFIDVVDWAVANDPGCFAGWMPAYESNRNARLVCKMSAY